MQKLSGQLSFLGFNRLVLIIVAFASLWITNLIVPGFFAEGWSFLLIGTILWTCNLIYSHSKITEIFNLNKFSLNCLSIFLLDTFLVWLTGKLLPNIIINNWQTNFWVALSFLLLTNSINHFLIPTYYCLYNNYSFSFNINLIYFYIIFLIIHISLFLIIPVVLFSIAIVFPKLITIDSIVTAIIAVFVVESIKHGAKTIIFSSIIIQAILGKWTYFTNLYINNIFLSIIISFFLDIFCLFPLYLWLANYLIKGLIIQGYFSHLIISIILRISSIPLKSWTAKLEKDYQKSLG